MNVLKFGVAVMALLTVTSCKQDGAKTDSAATDSPKILRLPLMMKNLSRPSRSETRFGWWKI